MIYSRFRCTWSAPHVPTRQAQVIRATDPGGAQLTLGLKVQLIRPALRSRMRGIAVANQHLNPVRELGRDGPVSCRHRMRAENGRYSITRKIPNWPIPPLPGRPTASRTKRIELPQRTTIQPNRPLTTSAGPARRVTA